MNKCSTEKLCKQCGKIISNRKADSKYCCDKCGSKYRNKYKIRKPLTEKQRELHRDRSRERQRRIRSTEEGRIKYNERIMSWKRNNKEKVIAQRRKYSPRKELDEKYSESLVEKNARDAFKWWMENKTDKEMIEWFMATGKPWLNPRLTNNEKYKIKVKYDQEYAISRRLYYRDRKIKRRMQIQIVNDGTVSGLVLSEAKKCVYCGIVFNDIVKKTIDHLVPLCKGGSHSSSNIVVCCLTCNSKKGSMDYEKWMDTLNENGKRNALRVWKKLKGLPPNQLTLFS